MDIKLNARNVITIAVIAALSGVLVQLVSSKVTLPGSGGRKRVL